MAHLPVPVAWLGVAGRGHNGALQQWQQGELIVDGGSSEAGPVQQPHRHQHAPVDHHEHAGVVSGVRAALEKEGTEDGDGGQRPARPGCGFLRWCGGVLSVCAERNKLGGALVIGKAEAGIESSLKLSRASPGDECRQ